MNPDDADGLNNSTETLPPGKYYAILDGASVKTAQTSGSTGEELTFRVVGGPFDGREIKDTLWHRGSDDEKTKRMKNRMLLFALRLGLCVRDGDKVAYVEGKSGFCDVLGAKVILDVDQEKWENKQTGKSGVQARVKFGGVFDVTDPKGWDGLTNPPKGVKPPKPDDKGVALVPPATATKAHANGVPKKAVSRDDI
jgi:hypothetical protein